MSREIDERVVSMRFDNDDFERKSKQSINTLNELDEALKFQNATSGLNALEQSASKINKINFSGFQGSIQRLGSEVVEMTKKVGLYRIVNSGLQQIENTIKSFTISPLTDGWGKYEQSIASVQKIVNATEKSLEEVQPYIDKLRWFTDETSYSMEGMSNALGDFTSQGIQLDEATTAMIGIANAAGNAGSSAEKATHAMTGFAKALGRGHMEGSSWQWIRTSGIAISSFKENALEAAVAAGTLKKGIDGVYRTVKKGTAVGLDNFEAAFTEGWFNKEAILGTLKKYGNATEEIYKIYADMDSKNLSPVTADIIDEYGDQFDELGIKAFRASQETKTFTEAIAAVRTAVSSKWAKTWEIIFGDYGADPESGARGLWRGFVDELWEIFVDPGDVRNTMLKGWAAGGGRDALFEGISNLWSGLKGIVQPLHDVLEKIFPPMTADRLIKLTEGFRDLTAKFRDAFPILDKAEKELDKIGETAAEIVQPIFETTEAIDELAKAVIRGEYGNGAERIEKLGDSFKKVQNKVNELLGCAFRYEIEQENVTDGAEDLKESLDEVEDQAKNTRTELDKGIQRMERIHTILGGLASAINLIKSALSGVASTGLKVLGKLGKLAIALGDGFLGLGAELGKLLKKWDENNKKNKIVTKAFAKIDDSIDLLGNSFSRLFKWVKQFSGPAYESLKKAGTWIINFIKEVYGHLRNTTVLSTLWNSIKKLATTLKDLGTGVLEKLINKFQDFFKLFKKKEDVEQGKTLAEKVSEAFEGFLETVTKVVDFVTGHLSDIGKFFGFFNDKNIANIDKASASVGSIFGDASSIGKGLSMFSKMSEKLEPFFESLNKYRKNTGEFFGDVVDEIINNLTKENLGALLKKANLTLLFGALSYFLVSVGNAASTISGKLAGGFLDLLGGVKDVFVSYQEQIRANNIMTIAKAIGILALALGGLTFVDQENLNNVTADMIAVLGVLAIVAKFFNVFNQNKVNNEIGDFAPTINVLGGLTQPFTNFLNSAAKSFRKAVVLPGLALVLLSFGGTMLMFLEVMKQISEMLSKDVEGVKYGFITLMGLLMATLFAVYGVLSSADGFDSLWDVAALVVSFGITVNLMVKAIKTISEMGYEDLERSAVIIAGLMAVLAFCAMLAGRGTVVAEKGSKFVTASGVVIAIIASMFAIVHVLKELNKMEHEDLEHSAIILACLMVAFGVMVGVATSMTRVAKNGNKIQSLVPSILAMAVAVLAIGHTLKQVGEIPLENLIISGLAIGAIGVAMTAMMSIANDIASGGNAGGVSAALLSMAIALIAIAGALRIVGTVSILNVLAFAAAIVILVAAIGGIAVVLNHFDAMKSFQQMAQSMLMIGIGAVALSAALYTLGYALPVFVQGLAQMGQILWDSAPQIALAIAAIIAAISIALLMQQGTLIETFISFFSGAFDEIIKWCGTLGPKVLAIVKIIINLFKLLIPFAIPGVIEVLVLLINNVADGIRNNGGAIVGALGNLIGAIIGLVGTAIGKLGDLFSPSGHGFTDWWANFFDTSEKNDEHPVQQWFGKFFNNITGAHRKAADEAGKEIESTNEEVNEKINSGMSLWPFGSGGGGGGGGYATYLLSALRTAKTEAGAEAGTIPGYMGDQFLENAPYLQNAFNTMSGNFDTSSVLSKFSGDLSTYLGAELPTEMSKYGLQNWLSYDSGAQEGTEYVYLTTDETADGSLEILENYNDDYRKTGTSNMDQYGYGLASSAKPASAATRIGNDTVRKTDVRSRMYDNGVNAALGFAQGIWDNLYKVEQAAKSIADAASSATKDRLRIESPSKVMAQLGMYTSMGFADGINKFAGLAGAAAENLGDRTIQALGGSISTIKDVINGDLSSSSTLRPVLDMSNVDSGLHRINTSFNAQRVSLAAASMEINNEYSQLDELVDMTARIFRQLQNGQDLYLDDNILAGRINRRLGLL